MLNDELRGNYGLARISINVQEWFHNTLKDNPANQGLTIFTGRGETVLQNKEAAFSLGSMKRIISAQTQNGHYKDERTLSLVNYSYIEELDWYAVSQMPLNELQQEVRRLRLRRRQSEAGYGIDVQPARGHVRQLRLQLIRETD